MMHVILLNWQIIIETTDFCGIVQYREGKIIGEVVRGYNTQGGGWSLYNSNGCIPAEFILFYPEGERKPIFLNKSKLNRISNVK